MKKYIIIGAASLITLLAGVIGFAQAKRAGHEHGVFGQRMAQQLGLSDAQQQQIKGILQAERPKMQPLMQELKQERQQMNSLTESGSFNEAAVRSAATKQAQTETDLAVERARVKSQIFAVLTPDQRTKAQEMEKSFAGRRARWGHRKGAGANQSSGTPGTGF
ncbi:MAG TPA: Spy/CpxP family protein refolding chaperone [Terriglobales bacterium]|nr:Spy/CpxP family protein refolding chaperone [Terriglobales bacterium]